jgi:hypothetical protein
MSTTKGDKVRVGYGSPPKHSRFKKGQSGNPKGRKKREDWREWENPLRKYLLEPMTVTIQGKKVTMAVVDLLIKKAIHRALEGCTRNLKVLLDGSGGLAALIDEQKRQATSADLAYIDEVYQEAEEWFGKRQK